MGHGAQLKRRYGTLEERFWAKVRKGADDECWAWTAGTVRAGYGYFRQGDRSSQAHRVSYEMHHGPIPEGMFVLHSCDNPPCVNPRHLRAGTPADNMRDMARRGRSTAGERHPRAKLTAAQVAEIRASFVPGGASGRDLAARFGVAHATINGIVRRKRWKCLPAKHKEAGA